MHKKFYIGIASLTGVLLLFFAQYAWQNNWYLLHRNTPAYTEPFHIKNESMGPNTLSIPSLGITAPIVYATSTHESELQNLLQDGVVHYAGTAEPGMAGNCYLFGHSSDYVWSKGNYKTIFATLPNIKLGSEIIVSNKFGKAYRYRVHETIIVDPNDLSVLAQDKGLINALTLQTSYPLGTALKRFIVIAQLQ
jgi:sortase A